MDNQESAGGSFDDAFMMKILKQVIMDDLRWCRWEGMLSQTYKKVVCHASEPETWFVQQLSIVLQRLLKGITAEKALTQSTIIFYTFVLILVSILTLNMLSYVTYIK